MPAVSVCIPAYCNPATLDRTLKSVITQEFTDYEIVITDDSPDRSVEHLVNDLETNVPVTYRRNSKRLGSPANWNYCVSLARGEFIKILHHDDWLSSNVSLASYVDLMRKDPDAHLGFSATIVSGVDGSVQRTHRPSRRSVAALNKNPRRLFPNNIVGSPSATIYRRAKGVEFDQNLMWVVDVDFYIRMLLDEPNLVFTPRPLVCTTNGLPSQVTFQSLGNKRVELFEWTYLYARLFNGTGAHPDPLQVKFMWDLLVRHDVASLEDFTTATGDMSVPALVARLIRARARLARLRAFVRWP